jgi:chitin-binding protein
VGFGHRFVGAAAACAFLVLSSGSPAQAHGALENPPSRAVVCGPEGGSTARSAVCRAAAAAGEPGALARFDDLRVPGVDGRDREEIPDGKLCSGGLAPYAGLDLPRADWPTTRLRSGAPITYRYRVTIPHRGTFKLYLTRSGFDPTQRLRWSDLESTPFLTAVDPVAAKGFYTLNGRLPAGRSGRNLIYAVWQTSDTPDTYYSCSDVDFGTPSTAQAGSRPSTAATAKKSTAAASQAPDEPIEVSPVAQNTTDSGSGDTFIFKALGGGIAVAGTATAIFYLARRFRHGQAQ